MPEAYETLKSVWNLRKHPFEPRVAPEGKGLLVLVSGIGHTGRGSMVKFLVHQFAVERQGDPLIINATLTRESGAENAKTVARKFKLQYGMTQSQELRATLENIYNTETAGKAPLSAPYYPALFDSLRTVIEPLDRPIVMLLKGPNQYSLCSDMYESLKDFSDLIVVTTNDPKQACTCKQTMDIRGKNAAWVDAPLLDEKTARSYLTERLARERLEDVQVGTDEELAPFTNKAVGELYLLADKHKASGPPPTWPIQFLNKRFRHAIDQHILRLETMVQQQGLAQMLAHDSDALRIDAKEIRDTNTNINRGGAK